MTGRWINAALMAVGSSALSATPLGSRAVALRGMGLRTHSYHVSASIAAAAPSFPVPLVALQGTDVESRPNEGRWRVPKQFVPVPFQYHEELELLVDDITNLGLGVGRVSLPSGERWVVMVPNVLPGETVRVRIFRNHDSYSEADLVSVLLPSSDRVVPQCPHFQQCGGCQYQHMAINAQRQWKQRQVLSVLQRIGKLDVRESDVLPPIGTSHHFGYRTKISPHFDLPVRGEPVKIGFQQRGSRQTVDIPQCIIASPPINAKYRTERESIIATFRHKPKAYKKGATLLFREADHGHVETDNRKDVNISVNHLTFQVKAGEFFQNNPHVLPLMIEHVFKQATAPGDCTHLLDTYCGSGLFALSCSAHFKVVVGVEVSDAAVRAADRNARLNGITNVRFVRGSAEAIFGMVRDVPRDQTVVVIDPPRKGCDDVFLNQLFNFRPKRLIYVSCDPATQARDAAVIVANGYSITCIQPFDLFPQTRHIENVITFARSA